MLSLEVVISAWEGAGMMTTMTNTETSTGMGPCMKKPTHPHRLGLTNPWLLLTYLWMLLNNVISGFYCVFAKLLSYNRCIPILPDSVLNR